MVMHVRQCGKAPRTLSELVFFFFQAEDGIRDLVRSRGLGDVYKRQGCRSAAFLSQPAARAISETIPMVSVDGLMREPFYLSLIHI